MADPVFRCPSDRWLAEFVAAASAAYRSSAEYRRRLNAERAPLFAHYPLNAASAA